MLPRERLPETPINTLEDFCRFILGDQGTGNPKCAACDGKGGYEAMESKTEQELREQIGQIIFARKNPTWFETMDLVSSILAIIHKAYPIMYREEAEQVRSFLDRGWAPPEEAKSYVKLAADQSLPSSGEVVLLNPDPFEKGFHLGQLAMIDAGWRKVELKEAK